MDTVIYQPNLQSVALAVPEIIAVAVYLPVSSQSPIQEPGPGSINFVDQAKALTTTLRRHVRCLYPIDWMIVFGVEAKDDDVKRDAATSLSATSSSVSNVSATSVGREKRQHSNTVSVSLCTLDIIIIIISIIIIIISYRRP